MGIVVCICLLLGLLLFLPCGQGKPNGILLSLTRNQKMAITSLLFVVGLWNIFWYGLRHWHAFWGQAAIISGLLMVLATIILQRQLDISRSSFSIKVERFVRPIKPLIVLGLFASFLLYTITLIQLNLGMEIIK